MSAAEKGETHKLSAGCLFKNLKKLALVGNWLDPTTSRVTFMRQTMGYIMPLSL